MRWNNDKKDCAIPEIPQGLEIQSFAERPDALNEWLDIVQYGLTDGRMGAECYKSCMTDRKWYDEKMCFFVINEGEAVATITVICDYDNKEGYIHMVACKPECRGRGIGNLLNDWAVYILKKEKMETAYLTTDDWRIPAIKSYLKFGFNPDLSTQDYKDRWQAILAKIG